MKILVTGSSGFIGFHLIKRLLREGHEIIGVDNHNDYYDVSLKELRLNSLGTKNFSFYKQDINKLSISESGFDMAINLAAQAGVRVKKEHEYLYEESNINGFKKFCEFCKLKGIDNIIYASSSSVYSERINGKFSESELNLVPKSKYGASKLANEQYAKQFMDISNISFVGLRFFSVYGPFGRPDMAYFSFTNSIKRNTAITLNNRGLMLRDMTYIDDIIDGICGAIIYMNNAKEQVRNEIFNLGNDQPISTKELLSTIEKKLKNTTEIKHLNTNNETLMTHADITKAKNLLRYDPKVSFEKGIELFLNWLITMKMYKKLRLGIVGHGFVGKATDWGFNKKVEKFIVDPLYGTCIADLQEFNPEIVFMCPDTNEQ